jgi:hypothetical protein
MKLRTVGVFSLLLVALAAFGTGCRPYRHAGVGLEIDIHSSNHHRDHHRDHREWNDDDHHDEVHHKHRDRNGRWVND